MKCPTCRAPWRAEPECARCGSDLAPLMQLAATAWRHRTAAAAALAAGRWNEAAHHASAANRLHRTAAGDELLVVAQMVAQSRP